MNQLFGLQHVGKRVFTKAQTSRAKDLQFTATEEERNQETVTFSKMESESLEREINGLYK